MRPKKIVLCVDDDDRILSVRKFLLETKGYKVVTATSAEQALEMFGAMKYELVVTDLVMPFMTGNELARRLKEIDPDVKVVIISGSVKAYAHAHHAYAFIPKGTPVSEFLDRLKTVAARKRGPKKGFGRNAYSDGLATALEPATIPG